VLSVRGFSIRRPRAREAIKLIQSVLDGGNDDESASPAITPAIATMIGMVGKF
jgi:hypothetical protein